MKRNVEWVILAGGDAAVLLLVTLTGFRSHNEEFNLVRVLSTWLPLCAAWALVAPWLGNFNVSLWRKPFQAWRALLAMVLAAPMAGFLRAAWLGTTVIPIFVVALGGVSALAMLAWRLAWAGLSRREGTWTKMH